MKSGMSTRRFCRTWERRASKSVRGRSGNTRSYWLAGSGRLLRCNIFLRKGKRGHRSLSMRSIQSRCRTWIWTNCSPGGVSLPRRNGLMCCCVPADLSRRISMSARSGTCCAVLCLWWRTTTTSASWVRGEPERAMSTRKSVRTASWSQGGRPPLQTCFTTWPAELLDWLGSGM